MSNILGLDLGSNSIGWALLKKENDILSLKQVGSRILPMDAALLGDFDKGNSTSQTKERTTFRSIRRLRERYLLRRERLHRVLNILGFLPAHYQSQIDFTEHLGKFLKNAEPKLAWRKGKDGKPEFLFQDAFNEMLAEFYQTQPQLAENDDKIPYDWTIYYLRKKALKQAVSKEELAWILLNFNQKRGYYQLREEEAEEKSNKLVEYCPLKVIRVEATDEKKGKDIWYNVYLENGLIYRRSSNGPLQNWEGCVKDFIVTTDLNNDGTPKTDKQGNVKRSIRLPDEKDWTLLKVKTENDIQHSGKTVGAYIYDFLLQHPKQKIRGKLIHTIERKFYKDELTAILKKQTECHPELQDRDMYERCIHELYPCNEAHKRLIGNHDFTYLFINDILFYQRPLKSKKSLISNCPYEWHTGIDTETGEIKKYAVKCIAKSHPLFQEFRLWQFIFNLRIYQREKYVDGRLKVDVDVTEEFLQSEEDYAALFEWLNNRAGIDQKTFLKYPPFKLSKTAANYRWNYVEDRTYPCNETRHAICSRLEKAGIKQALSPQQEEALWQLLYSVNGREELRKALGSFARKNGWDETAFVEALQKIPPFEKEYGAYSAKAIKRLLSLMRMGKYWSVDAIDKQTRINIKEKINNGWDDYVKSRSHNKVCQLKSIDQFHGLPLWLSCYVVYDRHSEAQDIEHWESPDDIDHYLNNFRQHSLHNPIVEQVVLETLRVVRDIWKQQGHIDEIHIELGRNMKETAKERARQTAKMVENENTNLRIKALLAEFLNPEYGIENVRPNSPSQQEILRIYEETVLNDAEIMPDDIAGILKKLRENKSPSKNEFTRYKCWLEQKYRSPYTGEIIPLAKLFTNAYEIEHIIPQSRYFDDSFSNKVICESEVNKLKSNQLGYEFIKNCHEKEVSVGFGKTVNIFSVAAYEAFVKEHYSAPGSSLKKKKLLMEDLPETFNERQMNDTRYISNLMKALLSNIVREKDAQGNYEQEATSKNVIVCSGGVTTRLKKDWGLNDVWNELVSPRFERLNKLTDTCSFGRWVSDGGKHYFQTDMPLELQRGFSKKRIDHRHHAMDAIVIACATRNHINYLNNESAKKDAKISRYDLRMLLCDKDKRIKKPWETFTQDVREALSNVIVSFKQNLRIINKCTNLYAGYNDEGKKVQKRQHKGDSWAIRKPLHKDTVFGLVNLRKIKEVRLSIALDTPNMIVDKSVKAKVLELMAYKYDKKRIEKYFKENAGLWKGFNTAKVAVYYFTNDSSKPLVALRKPLDTSFNQKEIESVTDSGIQKILLAHLANKGNNPEQAFSPEGIEEMNAHLTELNNGKPHQPIFKVRVYKPLGLKFPIGTKGNKSSKFVKTAKGTNLFFAIYLTEEGKRIYETIPLNIAIERQKQGLPTVPEQNANGNHLLFTLSPNDLVYLPTPEEIETGSINEIDMKRIYKTVSFKENRCFFIPQYIACGIVPILELGDNNKAERAWSEEMIKETCIPLRINRLGQIIQIGDKTYHP